VQQFARDGRIYDDDRLISARLVHPFLASCVVFTIGSVMQSVRHAIIAAAQTTLAAPARAADGSPFFAGKTVRVDPGGAAVPGSFTSMSSTLDCVSSLRARFAPIQLTVGIRDVCFNGNGRDSMQSAVMLPGLEISR
jgi:hypothetical protein